MPRHSSGKASRSVVFSVKTPEALQALEEWVAQLPSAVRKRGRDYFEAGQVLSVDVAADHYLEAEVEGDEEEEEGVFESTLFLTRGKWTSRCACEAEINCKHAAAAALLWIDTKGGAGEEAPSASLAPAKAASPAPAAPPPKKRSFREEWMPQLATKLGRPLTEAEAHRLGSLAALFTEMSQAHGRIFPDALSRHGFANVRPPSSSRYNPVFADWWDASHPPADPWALWQYIAYAYEVAGQEIPEVFQPMTDTTAVRALLYARVVQEELNTWNQALGPAIDLPPLRPSLESVTGVRARLAGDGGLVLEVRAGPDKPWKAPTQKMLTSLGEVRPVDLAAFTPAETALLLTFATAGRNAYPAPSSRLPLSKELAGAVLAFPATHGAIILPDGQPFAIEPEPLVPEATLASANREHLNVHLVAPDGRDASTALPLPIAGPPLYLFEGRVWRGPPPLPRRTLPTAALTDPRLMSRLRSAGLRVPASLTNVFRQVTLLPVLRLSLTEPSETSGTQQFHAQLLARATNPACEQHWSGIGGWQWAKGGAPPARRAEDPIWDFDLTAAHAVSARFAPLRLFWSEWENAWVRPATMSFPEEFIAWHASLPPGLAIEASPNLAGLLGAPLRGQLDFSAMPANGAGRDWFDLTVALRIEDTTLSADEIALLLKARGKWVRLPKLGWRRLELTTEAAGGDAAAVLDRLGLQADDVIDAGKPVTHRLHALQLASEAASLESRDAHLAAVLRDRAAAIAAAPPPALPAGLTATLRPYQLEGFHFLAHISVMGFGGILADDMGLGKTVQTLAWLLHLAAVPRAPQAGFRVLVVCPKSVIHGWLAETARFAPSLAATAFLPTLTTAAPDAPASGLLVANYTQLRLHAGWFQSVAWDVVVLDEGQFIKNPTSQAAVAARALPSRHRLVLTGTPVENRVTDLWSLFAFAQPGLLGTQAAFRRQYSQDDPSALARLHRRVRHFLLRRTKSQAAPDLPPRTEDEIVVELEPAQRQLYEAELKRARAQLLGIETDRALDSVRFNVLASLLRLRQICCHPALIDEAHAALPSAKLDALMERLEELSEEGHQVLVFSQFVEMLELIRARLETAGIGHLMLTGKTENRAELVEQFQGDRTKTVFLLSLKAAGFGLNLTAASYAILYDPWWNPAVEAQAIDRTHRIGQLRPVTAYRLLAADTVEQKIRALQKEKSALAAAVVQEESLASVIDLESLRRILQ